MEVIALSINRNIRIPQSDANKLLIKRVFWEGGAKPIMLEQQIYSLILII